VRARAALALARARSGDAAGAAEDRARDPRAERPGARRWERYAQRGGEIATATAADAPRGTARAALWCRSTSNPA
jgi:hypothetical protein